MVKCGRCQVAFEVEGAGRFSCPACGTANEVRAAGPAPSERNLIAPPPPSEPAPPSPRLECGDCGFSFIVGAVDQVSCPNCGVTVTASNSDLGSEGNL